MPLLENPVPVIGKNDLVEPNMPPSSLNQQSMGSVALIDPPKETYPLVGFTFFTNTLRLGNSPLNISDNASVGSGLTLTGSYVDIASIIIPVNGTYEFNITLVGKVGRVITGILRNSTTSTDNQQSLFNMINMIGSSDIPLLTSSKFVFIKC